MLGETKSQKNDTTDIANSLVQYKARGLSFLSYNKTNKLITALYMITDIMDKEEPLRNKLRSLGASIISDIYQLKGQTNFYNKINDRISEILSFLEIASGIGIVSEMNSNIITKEFSELQNSITEFTSKADQKWLEEFTKVPALGEVEVSTNYKNNSNIKAKEFSKGQTGTRIGVQKGSTLLKALSDRIPDLSVKRNSNELKDKRREEIIKIIKDKAVNTVHFDGATITDIKSIGQGTLASCGEKTLQRELVAMVSDGVLKKTGEKRWSRYSLN